MNLKDILDLLNQKAGDYDFLYRCKDECDLFEDRKAFEDLYKTICMIASKLQENIKE